MVSGALIPSFDLLLRGADSALLLLVATLLVRDHPRAPAARLGALFAAGAAAYAVCSTPGLHERLGWWSAPVAALASGNNLVFWLFARTLFDDGFRLRPRHGAAWAGVAALSLLNLFVLSPNSTLGQAAGLLLAAQAIGFAVLAGVQTMASWPADLVDARRRLRVFIVAAAIAHTVASTAASLLRNRGDLPAAFSILEPLALAAIAAVAVWPLLQVAGGEALFAPPRDTPRDDDARGPAVALDPAERALSAALDRAMNLDRAYRAETLTIGRLAQMLDVPEYRLRRLINGRLGWRNFNAYLNSHRLADARAALADPAQAEVPVLTIALDAGFNSLGPFNRAFKAATGATPTAYRRDALKGRRDDGAPKARRTSKSA